MKKHNLFYPKTIENWDEAISLGNGKIGCLIWGNEKALRFSLDRTDVWDLSEIDQMSEDDFTYQNLVSLAKAGNTEEIRRIFDAPYNMLTPTKLPVGKILLQFQEQGNVVSELDLSTAEAKLEVQMEQATIRIQAFCHAVDQSGYIRIFHGNEKVNVLLEHPVFGNMDDTEELVYDPNNRKISQGGLEQLHYPAAKCGESQGEVTLRWFEQQVDEKFSFGVVIGILKRDKETTVVYRIVNSNEGTNWLEDGKRCVEENVRNGYEKSFRTHQTWWDTYWKQSSVSLPDPFFEKQWYLTNYLFASCSRKGEYPMPLQGVWTADNGELPPWKGDYHNDLNTQLSYTHFYKANHLEEGEAFIDFLWNSIEMAKTFAKEFYDADGICLPGVMTINGKALGGWPMYSLSPTHQIWLCQSFELYYRYTGDVQFLKEKAWVYFTETEKCISSLLEEKDGKLYLPVSSSPEIHDDEKESWLTPNSNYDLALLRYLYYTLVEFSKILENGEEDFWRRKLEKLPQLAINEQNVLMLSPDEVLKESHRHLSNAMAIAPLHLLSYEDDKEIIDATVSAYELLGTGMWVGYSFVWMSHLYAIQKNGEGAYEQLRIFWESFCAENGFHLNGDFKRRGYSTFHYRPFTLEGNMYAADALQEMLLQMEKGVITVFPAIPEKWNGQTVKFEKFRGEKGLLVSAVKDEKNQCEILLEPQYDQVVSIKFGTIKVDNINLRAGKRLQIQLKQEKGEL